MSNVINFASFERADGRSRIDDLLQEAQQKLFVAGFFEELVWDRMEPELVLGAAEALARAQNLTRNQLEWRSVMCERVERITGLDEKACEALLKLRDDWDSLSDRFRMSMIREIAAMSAPDRPPSA